MFDGAKRSLYIFLTSLLGVLLFLILHRLLVFFYFYLLAGDYMTSSMSYMQFLVLDYFTLAIVLMLGAWYGIWLGIFWFDKVYVDKSHGGFMHHVSNNYFSRAPKNLENRISAVKQKIEKDLWQLEDLADASIKVATSTPAPIKRRVVRKAAPKKLKTVK